MDWRPVQGVPRLLPDDRWDRHQPPRDPTDGLDSIENGWMDVCLQILSAKRQFGSQQDLFKVTFFSLFF